MVIGWTETIVTTVGAVAILSVLMVVLPSRRLGLGIILWFFAPVIAYFGMIAWEVATRPPQDNIFGTALYGLALVSPIFLPPWFVVCCVGCVLGFLLRRLLRPAWGGTGAVTPAATARLPMSTFARAAMLATRCAEPATCPSALLTWRSVHVGFSGDDLTIGEVAIWKVGWQNWRPTGETPLPLPHPAHPKQTHRYDIYELGDLTHPVRFAVDELSNGVWGFYVPDRQVAAVRTPWPVPATILSRFSPDGSIRVDLAPVEWGNSHWIHAPRVVDLANGRGSCPEAWCSSIDSRQVRVGQAATAGSLTCGSSLKAARPSSVM